MLADPNDESPANVDAAVSISCLNYGIISRELSCKGCITFNQGNILKLTVMFCQVTLTVPREIAFTAKKKFNKVSVLNNSHFVSDVWIATWDCSGCKGEKGKVPVLTL
jgi:hypothetical protein